MSRQTAAPSRPDEVSASPVEHSLRGTVTNVLFASENGEYAVLRTVVGDRDCTLVGTLGSLAEGQDFEAWGRWETHKDHGRQFRVSHFKALPPSTEEGIRRYLASGVIPGVGPKLAERIVSKFGRDTLHILDQYSARLLEVPGLGKRKLATIRDGWRANSARRDIDIFLQGLGLTAAYCERVSKRYGEQTIALIKENPYRLASEIRGIGFRTSDEMARKLDIAADHPDRLLAGVDYVLRQMTEQGGHTCVPHHELVQRTAQILQVAEEVAARGVDRAAADQRIVVETLPTGAKPVYPLELRQAELQVAAALQALLTHRVLPADLDGLEHGEQWQQLNAAQREAVLQAFQQTVSIITGGPGVGKTTVTREIVSLADAMNWRLLLCAPTGRAARRLSESSGRQAQTIHRLLKWQPETRDFAHSPQLPLRADLIIVDEVSMLDIRLAAALFGALAVGTRVVLVGDRDQLPSVGPGSVLRDLIACGSIPVTHLHEVFRQGANSRIIVSAHAVNAGQIPDLRGPQRGGALSDFYWIDQEDAEEAAATICRLVAERIPKRFKVSARDIQVLTPMNRGVCGAINLNRELQQVLNPLAEGRWAPHFMIGDATVRPGDRLMQVTNNYDAQVFNGDLGRVGRIDTGEKQFTVQFDGGAVTYSFEDADQVRLAYAITIHKSQGSEFPVVVVPVLTQHYVMLQRNLIYTAMTRARRLLVLVGQQKALRMAIENVNLSPRYSRLHERLRHP